MLVAGALAVLAFAVWDLWLRPRPPTLSEAVSAARAAFAGEAGREAPAYLFIGNSHSFIHDVPAQVADLIASTGRPRPRVAMVAFGGAWLALYARRPTVAALIADLPWDAVVLQEASPEQLFEANRARSRHAFAKLGRAARDTGARVLIYGTWPYRGDHGFYTRPAEPGFAAPRRPEAMAQLTAAELAATARAISADLVPAGRAWLAAMERHPDIRLYRRDGNHSAPAGAYLSALMLAAALSGADPAAMTWRPDGLAAGAAQRLRAVASRIAAAE